MRTVEDHLIDRLEAAQTREYAKRQRRHLGWESLGRVDPLSLESVREIWTVRGRTPLRLQFVEDDDVRGEPGRTTYDGRALVVHIPERTRRKAFVGDGKARCAVAREVGHATLRHPETMMALLDKFRRQPEGGVTRKVLVSAYASLKFQASIFAAMLLMGDNVDPRFASPEELSVRYGIDTLSARVFFAEIQSTAPPP
jgi:hypothetical protein